MIKAFDFFCGAGGLTRGLLDAKVKVYAGIDNDDRLKDTYEKNNRPSRFKHADITTLDIHALREEFGVTDEDRVLYAACTPCQPFSTLNQMKGEDERKSLLLHFARVVKEAPPDYIIVENVPGLNTAYGRDIYESFLETLNRSGFQKPYSGFLDAADFGVPQVRKRFIMLASRHGEIPAPAKHRRRTTVRQAIGHLPTIVHGSAHCSIPNHEARRLMDHHMEIVKAVPVDGGSRSDVEDTSILLKCHQERPTVHKDVFGRIRWNDQAPTMTCRCTDVYCGRFVHPDQNRGLTVREAAALQTFPNRYNFYGTLHHCAKQVGNAVPVRFAKRLAETIVKFEESVAYG